jgi:CubicO group peptidase (beta-lactamase class C family)
MKLKLIIVGLLSLCSISIVSAQAKEKKLDELLTAYNSINEFNGTALVEQKGTVLLNKGYGYKNAATDELNTENTIFQIGSITKQFTAAVILKLAENKKLSLSDKISKYFNDLNFNKDITIAQLLSHTSGIYNYTNNVQFMQSEAVKPADEKKMLALFKNKPLDFSPGTNWSYSNSGYLLLGYIIEKVTKKSYEQVVRDYIFKPLKMNTSGFDFAALKNKDKATGYFSIDGKNSTVAGIVDSSVSYAAGAIYTTTSDLLKWHKAILSNTVIKRTSIEKAFTPVKNKYGFGWIIDSIDGKRVTAHGGAIFGFNTNIARIESDDICIVLLNNTGNPKLADITNDIFAVLYDKPYKLPEVKKEITLPEEILKKYIGTYEAAPQFLIIITVEEGKLIAQATGQPKFQLFAQKENYFFLKAVAAEVEFVSNDKGEVEKLILYQGSEKTPALKIK